MPNIPQATRDKLDAKGETMPGGRYPIRNAKDLSDAYKDYVRTGKPAAVAAWIGERAKALGLPNPISGAEGSAAEEKSETPAQEKAEDGGDELAAARRYTRKPK